MSLPPTPTFGSSSQESTPPQARSKRKLYDSPDTSAGRRPRRGGDASDMRPGAYSATEMAKPFQRDPPHPPERLGLSNQVYRHRTFHRIRSYDADLVSDGGVNRYRSYMMDLGVNHMARYWTAAERTAAALATYLKVNKLVVRVKNMGIISPWATATTETSGSVSTLQGYALVMIGGNQLGEYEKRTYTRNQTGNGINSTAGPSTDTTLQSQYYSKDGGFAQPINIDQGGTWITGGTGGNFANGYVPAIAEHATVINANSTINEIIAEWEYTFGPNDGIIRSYTTKNNNPQLLPTATTPATHGMRHHQYNTAFKGRSAGKTDTSDVPREFSFIDATQTNTINNDYLFDAYIGTTTNAQYDGQTTSVIPNLMIGILPCPTATGPMTVQQALHIMIETELYCESMAQQDHLSAVDNALVAGRKREQLQRYSYTGLSNRHFLGYPVIETAQTRMNRFVTPPKEEELNEEEESDYE